MTFPLFAEFGETIDATTDERYTPKWLFDSLCLHFDLDVAAPQAGADWIPTTRRYTKTDDGLAQPWVGLVWCNPPFSDPTPWAQRWTEHGNGVWLGPVSNGRWVPTLMRAADVVWFSDSPIQFISPEGVPGGIPLRTFVAGIGDTGSAGVKRLAQAARGALLRPIKAVA